MTFQTSLRAALRRCRSLLRFASTLALATALVSPGCNSNFIPVPPPGDPTFEPLAVSDAMGGSRQVWQVSGAGEALRGARIFIFNDSLKVGVIGQANAAGAYTAGLLEGAEGDRVELRYETPDGEQSPAICRLLTVGTSRTPCP